MASARPMGPPDKPVVIAATASSAEADVDVVVVVAAEVVARERVQPLPTEWSLAVASTPRGSAPKGPPPLGISPLAARSADTETRSPTDTTISLHRRARAHMSTLTSRDSQVLEAAIASHTSHSSRSNHTVAVRKKRGSRASTARTNRTRCGSHRVPVSHRLNASLPRNARHQRPANRRSRASHPNRVNPRPINSHFRPRPVARARNRPVRRSHLLSGPPHRHTTVVTSK